MGLVEKDHLWLRAVDLSVSADGGQRCHSPSGQEDLNMDRKKIDMSQYNFCD